MTQPDEQAPMRRSIDRVRSATQDTVSTTVLLHVAFVMLIAVHAAFVFARVDGDAGVFMTIGDAFLDGRLPYADFVDHKPPGIYFVLAGIFAVVRSAIAAKALVFLVNGTTAALLIRFGRRRVGTPYGLVAACLFLAGSLAYSGPRVYTEQFVALFGLFATLTYAATLGEQSMWRYALAGVLVGVATLFKQTGLAFAGAFVLVTVIWTERESAGRSALDVAPLLGGVLLPLVAAGGYFAVRGALDPMLHWTLFVHAPGGPYTPNPLQVVAGNLREIGIFPLLWVLAPAGLVFAASARISRPIRLIAVIGLFSATPLLIRGWGHYYLQLLPFAALLAAFAVRELIVALDPVADRPKIRVLAVIAVVVLTIPVVHVVTVTAVDDLARHNVFDDQRHGSFIRSETATDEPILTLGEQAKFYFLADRSPPNRHLYYLSINRRVADQRELRETMNRGAVPLVVIGSPCQSEIRETCARVRESYGVTRRDGVLAFYEPANQTVRTGTG